ncbi:MAG: Lactate utilization protein A [Candidatus Latescibacteria bacterium ADurb.Bin168]|nr:MAG: Lactate utilization protein A [Candidatus Latescibacteria bacterium ADurb.Bin168]
MFGKRKRLLPDAVKKQENNLLACVHCGFCLPHCPTYSVLGDENDSPRGRLYLMRAAAEGRITPDEAYTRHIESCIVCRACETACPSGVRYGTIMEAARHDLRRLGASDMGWLARALRWMGLYLLPRRSLLRPAVYPMRVIRHLRPSNGWWRWLPSIVRLGLEMLPPPPRKGEFAPVSPQAPERGAVVQFRGCVMDELFKNVNQATTRVLAVNGFRVTVPQAQTCCGSLHDHSGFVDAARELARKNIDSLEDSNDTPIVVNAAGCAALMKEYGELLKDDPRYAARAHRFASRVCDVTELLARTGVVKGAPIRRKVTYDAPCHLYHAQKVKTAPLDVLKGVPDLDFRPLRGADRCCASGGIYNLTHADIAEEVLQRKLSALFETGAETLVTANPGCQMQIQAGVRQAGMDVSVAHVIELLDESYEKAGYYGNTTSSKG